MPTSQNESSSNVIYIGSDHAGFDLKEKIKARFPMFEWRDCGPLDTSRVDYPDYADRVAKEVLRANGRGVLVCGSGQGMAIRANRYHGIRAALVWNEESTKLSREHNDANIICLGARLLDHDLALHLVELFFATRFEGGRHQDRVDKLGKPPSTDAC